MSLGDILTKHFGCKRPFYKRPKVVDQIDKETYIHRYITQTGDRAYGKLVALIYDLGELLPDTVDAESIIEELDHIADGEIY